VPSITVRPAPSCCAFDMTSDDKEELAIEQFRVKRLIKTLKGLQRAQEPL